MVCQILDHHLNLVKLPYVIKYEVQTNITDVEMANTFTGFNSGHIIDVQLNEGKLFDSIPPSQMAEYQKKDTQLSLIYDCVINNSKPKLSEIHRIRSKPIHTLTIAV